RTPTGTQPPHRAEQTQTLITYTENVVTNRNEQPDWYRIAVPVETRTYELTGLKRAGDGPYTLLELASAASGAPIIQYEDRADCVSLQKRLIERARTLYRKNDLTGPLPTGEIKSLALSWESYRMAFTPGLLTKIYGTKATSPLADLFSKEARYVDLDGD